MAEQTPYEHLGVTEDASFDEIQEARKRLMDECGDDRQQIAAIESAYDAVLMHRLRLRQAGKIKVPDRIRFAEENPESVLSPSVGAGGNASPDWLKSYLDQPSPNDILWSGLILGGFAAIVLVVPTLSSSILSLLIFLAGGTSTYFLNRKENRLGRSMLLSLGGVIIGAILGYVILRLFLMPLVMSNALSAAQWVTAFSFVGLWWTCSFLR